MTSQSAKQSGSQLILGKLLRVRNNNNNKKKFKD